MKLKQIKIHDKICLSPLDKKFFRLEKKLHVDFLTDEFCVCMKLTPGWITDLRSGCDLINPIVPKWGNKEYTVCVLAHDCAFSGWISFDLCNSLFLKDGMSFSKQISKPIATIAANVVSVFGKSSYSFLDEEMKHPYENIRAFEKMEITDNICHV